MSRNVIETVMGAVVLVTAGGFLAFAYQSSNVKSVEGYEVTARFDSAAGLAPGSDVRIGGIKVGVVDTMELDSDTYRAVVTLEVKEGTRIPADSSAAIVSDGLLGSKYVAIVPGADDTLLKDGEGIDFTQSSVNIEELIGKMVFSGGGVDGKNGPARNDAKVLPEAGGAGAPAANP